VTAYPVRHAHPLSRTAAAENYDGITDGRESTVTMDRIRATIMRAWARLDRGAARRREDPPRPGRPRDTGTPVPAEATDALGKPGFAEEALPWLDAVHRFALRLTRDPTAAEDLVQETYLRAFRSWDQFDRGTNCRSWLFTICRNSHLHERERASMRYEVTESDIRDAEDATSRSFMDQHAVATGSPDDFFKVILDDALVAAIDALSGDFREVLILSDLGDLTYPEISEVLAIPIGTVKSRLFRARHQVRDMLLSGADSAYGPRGPMPDRGTL
jgi:RNA polymerase sigma-70 factor, ECF subfamily